MRLRPLMRHCRWPWVGMVLLAALPARAGLLDPPPEAWVAPGRLFSIKIPPRWTVELHADDPYTYDFRPKNKSVDARLRLSRILVPKQANPRQLLLNDVEGALSKLSDFEVLAKKNMRLSGYRAARLKGRYDFQGNVQYPRYVEKTYVIVGEEAFVFQLECHPQLKPRLKRDLRVFYDNFTVRPPGVHADPFAVPSETDTSNVRNLPF